MKKAGMMVRSRRLQVVTYFEFCLDGMKVEMIFCLFIIIFIFIFIIIVMMMMMIRYLCNNDEMKMLFFCRD